MDGEDRMAPHVGVEVAERRDQPPRPDQQNFEHFARFPARTYQGERPPTWLTRRRSYPCGCLSDDILEPE